MTSSSPSVPNFFEDGSPFLKHPLLTAERTAQEIDFLANQLDLGLRARILDVGCGFGRHSIELARRGYDVTGIDPSAAMISAARERSIAAGVSVDFRQERGEHFSTDQLYDAAICLFTTFGQISAQGDNTALAQQICAALKDGASFVLEVPQREKTLSQLEPREELGKGDRKAFVSRSYDANNQVLSEEFRIVLENEERNYLLRYRLFDRAELETYLTEAGFQEIAAYGDYQGAGLSAEDPAMLLVARKGR